MDRVPTRPLDGHLLGHRLHLLEANDIGILLGNPVEQSLAQRCAQAIDVPRSQLHGQNLAVYRASAQSGGLGMDLGAAIARAGAGPVSSPGQDPKCRVRKSRINWISGSPATVWALANSRHSKFRPASFKACACPRTGNMGTTES